MPFRQRGSFGRRRSFRRPVINTIKREINAIQGVTAATNVVHTIAIAVDAPTTAGANQVHQGSIIKACWIEFWYYGLSADNTNDIIDIYLMKNPGANLTPPNPGTVGTSNEKKFVFQEWKGLAGTKTTGGMPYYQQGKWFKIPKIYQRFGTDDTLVLVARSPTTGNWCTKTIIKEQF